MQKKITILILSLLCFYSTKAQVDDYLSNFKIAQDKETLIISWSTKAGFTCQDLNVELSFDSLNYESIYLYPGICGSELIEQDYAYVFSKVPLNKALYLRINLGNFGISEPLKVLVRSFGINGTAIIPHPATKEAVIYFDNYYHKAVKLGIHGLQGQFIGTYNLGNITSIKLGDLGALEVGSYVLTTEIGGLISRRLFLVTD